MIKLYNDGKRITAALYGDIDHHAARKMREELDNVIARSAPEMLIIDLENVGFMDSSGIGLVMGRYKLMKSMGGEIRVENLSAGAYRVMRLAGLERLGEIKQKELV